MHEDLRKIIVSPEINCPESFPGFGGFCGWPRICRLLNGDLYVTFSAGYWHASWVNPRPDLPPDYADYMETHMAGGATWDAPTGGHIMWTRSQDEGATWTPPRDLLVLPDAYAPGAIMQHSDGTMYAAALIQSGHYWAGNLPEQPIEFLRRMHESFPEQIVVLRSEDLGESWQEVGRTSGPFLTRLEHPCSITEAPDGSLLMLTDGHAAPVSESRWVNALLHSTDRGQSWQTRSIFGDGERDMEEGHLAILPDGRLGTASRPWGLWTTSDDEGFTWSEPRPLLEFELPEGRSHPNAFKKGDLIALSDGTLVQLTCGGPGGNGQVLYSRDSGRNWVSDGDDRGFRADRFAYYPSACVLADDSVFMVGDHQGFPNRHGPFGAEVVASRFRILPEEEGRGIERLPIGGDLHLPAGVQVDAGGRTDEQL
ncbi:MAG: exo-alpha-sialidase [Gemmatimonadetes bacterium]|nr:exo-alpha-sialidase [Gemmatimonadota bacterium]MBT6144645.1 exo-alpha-sialidase [Gemmatimonadota bacterium]MBT7861987.1 exo-alpha-sialidase [Gemmatimonadota bacterium]